MGTTDDGARYDPHLTRSVLTRGAGAFIPGYEPAAPAMSPAEFLSILEATGHAAEEDAARALSKSRSMIQKMKAGSAPCRGDHRSSRQEAPGRLPRRPGGRAGRRRDRGRGVARQRRILDRHRPAGAVASDDRRRMRRRHRRDDHLPGRRSLVTLDTGSYSRHDESSPAAAGMTRPKRIGTLTPRPCRGCTTKAPGTPTSARGIDLTTDADTAAFTVSHRQRGERPRAHSEERARGRCGGAAIAFDRWHKLAHA